MARIPVPPCAWKPLFICSWLFPRYSDLKTATCGLLHCQSEAYIIQMSVSYNMILAQLKHVPEGRACPTKRLRPPATFCQRCYKKMPLFL